MKNLLIYFVLMVPTMGYSQIIDLTIHKPFDDLDLVTFLSEEDVLLGAFFDAPILKEEFYAQIIDLTIEGDSGEYFIELEDWIIEEGRFTIPLGINDEIPNNTDWLIIFRKENGQYLSEVSIRYDYDSKDVWVNDEIYTKLIELFEK